MTMRGDELVSLLDGYVSSLEKLVAREDVAYSGRLSSLDAQFSGYAPTGGERGGENNLSSELLSGSTSTPIGSSVTEELGQVMAAGLAAMRMAWSSQSGGELTNSLDTLAGGGRYGGSGAMDAGGGPFSPVTSALLDLFRGGPATGLEGQMDSQRYAWQSPIRPLEGLVDRGSRIAGVDSAFDGSPRAIERQHFTPSRIDVRIEALDARSFLDRKEDIAEAVRQAMLTSGAFGTALNEY